MKKKGEKKTFLKTFFSVSCEWASCEWVSCEWVSLSESVVSEWVVSKSVLSAWVVSEWVVIEWVVSEWVVSESVVNEWVSCYVIKLIMRLYDMLGCLNQSSNGFFAMVSKEDRLPHNSVWTYIPRLLRLMHTLLLFWLLTWETQTFDSYDRAMCYSGIPDLFDHSLPPHIFFLNLILCSSAVPTCRSYLKFPFLNVSIKLTSTMMYDS